MHSSINNSHITHHKSINKKKSIYNYNSNPNNTIYNSPSNPLINPNINSLYKSNYLPTNPQYSNSKKYLADNTSSSINLKKKKSSQKSINSRKSIFTKQNESFASQMMLKRQKIIQKKIGLNKKADFIGNSKKSLYKSNDKNYMKNSSLYPSLANNKYSNPILKCKKKHSNENSLIQNSIFYKQDPLLRRNNKNVNLHKSPHERGYMLAKNLSESYLFQDKNHPEINSKHKSIKNHSQDQVKIRSQDKYIIQRDKFIQRSKNLNKSLQVYQSNSQPKKVISLFLTN